MFPTSAKQNGGDLRLMNTDTVRDALLCPALRAQLSNLMNVGLGQFGMVMIRTMRHFAATFRPCVRQHVAHRGFVALPTTAAFVEHVSGVLSGRPEKQVIGIHAGAIVASVQAIHAWWNIATEQEPRRPMGALIFPERSHFAVPSPIERSGPDPTRVRFLHVTPERVRPRQTWRNTFRAALRFSRTVLDFRMPTTFVAGVAVDAQSTRKMRAVRMTQRGTHGGILHKKTQ